MADRRSWARARIGPGRARLRAGRRRGQRVCAEREAAAAPRTAPLSVASTRVRAAAQAGAEAVAGEAVAAVDPDRAARRAAPAQHRLGSARRSSAGSAPAPSRCGRPVVLHARSVGPRGRRRNRAAVESARGGVWTVARLAAYWRRAPRSARARRPARRSPRGRASGRSRARRPRAGVLADHPQLQRRRDRPVERCSGRRRGARPSSAPGRDRDRRRERLDRLRAASLDRPGDLLVAAAAHQRAAQRLVGERRDRRVAVDRDVGLDLVVGALREAASGRAGSARPRHERGDEDEQRDPLGAARGGLRDRRPRPCCGRRGSRARGRRAAPRRSAPRSCRACASATGVLSSPEPGMSSAVTRWPASSSGPMHRLPAPGAPEGAVNEHEACHRLPLLSRSVARRPGALRAGSPCRRSVQPRCAATSVGLRSRESARPTVRHSIGLTRPLHEPQHGVPRRRGAARPHRAQPSGCE